MSRNKDLDPQRLNASWSGFWTSSTVTALPENFPAGYDGAMLDFWREQLDGDFSHILDLATGNGALDRSPDDYPTIRAVLREMPYSAHSSVTERVPRR